MWARIRFDISYADLAWALARCLSPVCREAVQQRVEEEWSSAGDGTDALACYSVRSGFDLALRALDLPRGSEVLFSALNIKGMVKIARQHGLVPVPIDLDPSTMAPSLEAMERAISPRSRAVVIAHLFGTRIEMSPYLELARRYGLIAVEDCAQAFSGRVYRGHPESDISMFSFGSLKTATALGGALLRVRDRALCERMTEIQSTYPVLGRGAYARRLLRFAGLALMLTRPVLGAVTRTFQLFGRDYEDPISDAVRSAVPLGKGRKYRKQPSAALLCLIERRVRRFDERSLEARAATGERLRALIGGTVACPASEAPHHTYWVFPITVEDPAFVIEGMRRAGFDAATLPRSATVPAPEDRPKLEPTAAAEVLSKLVVLPCYPSMPGRELAREADLLKRLVRPGR